MPATGTDLLNLASTRVGEIYRNVLVPKDDADWHGPWDCAEFASWVVYQTSGILYGCDAQNQNPRTTEAYTGFWEDDARRRGQRISIDEAAGTVGGIVLRYPPSPGSMGHIAFCDGRGRTVEAKGRAFGVVRDVVNGRPWDTGVLVPGIQYDASAMIPILRPERIYAVGAAGMDRDIVREIQRLLSEFKISENPDRFLNPGPIDGSYGPNTAAAVAAFQEIHGLVVDGQVGPQTAAALGINLQTGRRTTPIIPGDQSSREGAVERPAARPTSRAARRGRPERPEDREGEIRLRFTDILSTEFGGGDEAGMPSAYGGEVNPNRPEASLPARVPRSRRRIKVLNPANERSVECIVNDVGPWNTRDDYWNRDDRPRAEEQHRTRQEADNGRIPSNDAGLDLTPAAMEALGVTGRINTRRVRVDWDFV